MSLNGTIWCDIEVPVATLAEHLGLDDIQELHRRAQGLPEPGRGDRSPEDMIRDIARSIERGDAVTLNARLHALCMTVVGTPVIGQVAIVRSGRSVLGLERSGTG